MTRNVLPTAETETAESSTRLFQLDPGGFANIPASVNLFRGEVSHPIRLVDLPGRGGLALRVTALYSSGVTRAATTWNAGAPTGLLGLGWSLDVDRIVVDDKSTGNPLDGDYFLVAGGVTERLEWYGSDGDDLLFQSREQPLWLVRYQMADQTWQILRDDGSVAVYGHPAGGNGAVMYGVAWANWIGASRTPSAELRRYPVGWNLAEVRSAGGDTMTWSYENDEVEVTAGLTYTRAAYVQQITDMLGRTVRFNYLPKDRYEYVPPHQTAAGEPDTAFQDRYETRFLTSLDVSAGRAADQVLYTVRFGYDLRDVSGRDDERFTKRFLTTIGLDRLGKQVTPALRLEYQNDAGQPNPGALRSIVYSDGGRATFDYADVTLDAAGSGHIFDKNITVANPVDGSRPLVFHGPDYIVIAWYSEPAAETLIEVYSFGGRWTVPWSPPQAVPGRIQPQEVRFAAGADFFALYLCPANAGSRATVYLFQKEPYRFGEWTQHVLEVDRAGTDVPQETALCAGERFVVLHLGGDWRVHRFWFDPVHTTWLHAEDARNGSTQVALAARRNFYLVAWYDTSTRTAPGQIFHRDLTGTWAAAELGGAGQQFDWDPGYARTYWAAGDSFAVATYSAGAGQYRLRLLRWTSDYRLAQDEIRAGLAPISYVAGDVVGNGPLVLRLDAGAWHSFEMFVGNDVEARYAYGDDLAILSRIQGSGATTTVVRYDPDAARWRVLEDTGPALAAPALDQVWPPSIGGRVTTITEDVRWRDPDGTLRLIGSLPVPGAKRSLCNRGPSYVLFEDQPSDPTDTTVSVLLLRNGEIAQTISYAGQRSGTDDPAVPAAQLAGAQAFVTYPGGQSIARPSELFLHRILDQSLDDRTVMPVVSLVTVDDGYQSLETRYVYDTATAVPDASGTSVCFAMAERISGADGEGGRNLYSFYNGLPAPRLPLLRHTSRAVLAESSDDWSLLTGMVREARVLDSDGFEVSASHSVWSTMRLDTGPASPVGVMLPAALPKLTRQTVLTGKLRLSHLPGSAAADLDSEVLSPAVHDDFAAHGVPLTDAATVSVVVLGQRWEILDETAEYPVHVSGDVLEVLTVVRSDTTSSYDTATGYLLEQETSEFDSSGARQVARSRLTPAWRVPQYAGLKAARMLTAQAGRTLSNVTAGITISATAATYRADWPAPAPRVWAQSATYTWRADAATAPPFDYTPGAENPDWIRDQACTARTRYGQPAVTLDVAGVPSSTLFDAAEQYPVAGMVNVDLAAAGRQASYLGFEDYEQLQGWRRSDDKPLESLIAAGSAHTGQRCLQLPGQADGPAVENDFVIPAGTGRGLLACWARTAPGFPARPDAGWHIELRSADGTTATRTLAIPDTGGSWQQAWIHLDPPDPRQDTEVTCRLLNPVAGWAIDVDDLRVAPLEGGVTALVYDNASHLVTAALDTNNNTTSYYYDDLLRQIATSGPGQRVRQVTAWCYSRDTGAAFDPASPNVTVDVRAAGDGFVDQFSAGQPWQNRWQASDPDGWQVDGDVLVHTSDTPGTLTLRGSDSYRWYGVRLDFHAPPPGLSAAPAAGMSAGRAGVRWDPQAGCWQMTDAGVVVAQSAATPLTSASWLLIASRDCALFLLDGRQILAHWFSEPVTGPLTLEAGGPGIGFSRVMFFHQPRVAITCTDGGGRVRQRQALGDEGTVAAAFLNDPLGRQAVTTKAMLYSGGPPGYRPGLVTGLDWATGVLSGDVASYYSGGERSDDQGYPYRRDRFEAAQTARTVERGQPGLTLAISPGAEHTTRIGYGANVTDGFLDDLPAAQYPVTESVDPDGVVTVTVTDQAGRLLGTRVAPGSGSGDGSGDAADIRTSYHYDARGALVRIDPPDFHAPPPGSQPGSYSITRTVDGFGRVTSVRTCDTGDTEYSYDTRGLLRFSLVAAGRGAGTGATQDRIGYTRYDKLGRPAETGEVDAVWDRAALQALADSDWPPDSPGWRERHQWDGDGTEPDAIGRLSRTDRNAVPGQDKLTIRYSYNPAGLLTRYFQQNGGGEPGWETDYRYLGTGEVAAVSYPHQPGAKPLTIRYDHDPLGQTVAVGRDDAPGIFASYRYDANGAVLTETLSPSAARPVIRGYRYNSPGWLAATESEPFTERISYWEQPGYGGARYYGGQAARLDYGFGSGTGYHWLLGYGRDGRLRTAQNSLSDAYSLGTNGQPAAYDADANPLTVNDGGQTRVWEYQAGANLLRNVDKPGSDDYGYDPSGRTAVTPDPLGHRIETDLLTGLTTAVIADDGTRVDLSYGPGTRRLRKTRHDAAGQILSEWRYLLGAGTAPLREQVVTAGRSGAEETTYVYGPTGLITLIAADGTTGLVVKDRTGSSRLLLGLDGELLGGYNYRPFGDPMGTVTGSRPELLSYRFTGQELDAETGLYNFRARMYSPAVWRFYNPDPAGRSASPYSYVLADPINLTDPDGAIFDSVLGVVMGTTLTVGLFLTIAANPASIGYAVMGGTAAVLTLAAVDLHSTNNKFGSWHSGDAYWDAFLLGAAAGAIAGSSTAAATANPVNGAGAAAMAGMVAAFTVMAVYGIAGSGTGTVGGSTTSGITTSVSGVLTDGKPGGSSWNGAGTARSWGTVAPGGSGAAQRQGTQASSVPDTPAPALAAAPREQAQSGAGRPAGGQAAETAADGRPGRAVAPLAPAPGYGQAGSAGAATVGPAADTPALTAATAVTSPVIASSPGASQGDVAQSSHGSPLAAAWKRLFAS
ncbi:MAG: hypothetical protein JO345_37040 [Streptosporangiaceae bacterium]|nr:hypothetical protein [Streptosporangiaceae bacterium]